MLGARHPDYLGARQLRVKSIRAECPQIKGCAIYAGHVIHRWRKARSLPQTWVSSGATQLADCQHHGSRAGSLAKPGPKFDRRMREFGRRVRGGYCGALASAVRRFWSAAIG